MSAKDFAGIPSDAILARVKALVEKHDKPENIKKVDLLIAKTKKDGKEAALIVNLHKKYKIPAADIDAWKTEMKKNTNDKNESGSSSTNAKNDSGSDAAHDQQQRSPSYLSKIIPMSPYSPQIRISQEMLDGLQQVIAHTATEMTARAAAPAQRQLINTITGRKEEGCDDDDDDGDDEDLYVDDQDIAMLERQVKLLRENLRTVRECDRQRLATLKSRHQTATYRLQRMQEDVACRRSSSSLLYHHSGGTAAAEKQEKRPLHFSSPTSSYFIGH